MVTYSPHRCGRLTLATTFWMCHICCCSAWLHGCFCERAPVFSHRPWRNPPLPLPRVRPLHLPASASTFTSVLARLQCPSRLEDQLEFCCTSSFLEPMTKVSVGASTAASPPADSPPAAASLSGSRSCLISAVGVEEWKAAGPPPPRGAGSCFSSSG